MPQRIHVMTTSQTLKISVEGLLPLPDNFADVLISNGVLNLNPDREKTLRDWARVLKHGGLL